EQLAIRLDRLVGAADDPDLLLRLEPALDPLMRVRDDRRTRRRQLERAGRGRPRELRVRATRDVQVDPRRRDRAAEDVERHVTDRPGATRVAAEVAPAEREVDAGQAAARLAQHPSRPVAAELVAVAVEEDVDLLLDRQRLEELRVGAPEDRLGAPGAE